MSDRELKVALQVEKILNSFARFHELKMLTEMNGRICAGRQLQRLWIYDRVQRKVA